MSSKMATKVKLDLCFQSSLGEENRAIEGRLDTELDGIVRFPAISQSVLLCPSLIAELFAYVRSSAVTNSISKTSESSSA